MDPSSITTALSALKGVFDVANGLRSFKNKAELDALAIEFNGKLLEAQQAMFAVNDERQHLIDKIRALEAQLSDKEEWEREKVRYALKSPWAGSPVSVFHLMKKFADGEEPHWLCPNCFQNKKKSILNPHHKTREPVHLVCSVCKASINVGFNGIGGAQYAEDVAC